MELYQRVSFRISIRTSWVLRGAVSATGPPRRPRLARSLSLSLLLHDPKRLPLGEGEELTLDLLHLLRLQLNIYLYAGGVAHTEPRPKRSPTPNTINAIAIIPALLSEGRYSEDPSKLALQLVQGHRKALKDRLQDLQDFSLIEAPQAHSGEGQVSLPPGVVP